MKAVIVAEGSSSSGFGHVRRCLSLADVLAARGVAVAFSVWGDMRVSDLIRPEGYEVRASSEGAVSPGSVETMRPDVIVADSYSLTSRHLEALRGIAPLVVIDDLADRFFPADIVVNSSPHAPGLKYRALPGTRFLLGPEYAILWSEFAEFPTRRIEGKVRRILVTMGGGDPLNLTPRAVRAIRSVLGDVQIDAVIGPFFEKGRGLPVEEATLHIAPKSLCGLMAGTDLAVTGGGQTTYELAATGTPAVVMAVADNQVPQVTAWESLGVLQYVGDARIPSTLEKMGTGVHRLASDQEVRKAMSERGRKAVDGRGAERVADAVVRG
jgi:UDP-2,4-diacetamido-2,4,6-trideoxy-beta-L-altropyranose hydrolase